VYRSALGDDAVAEHGDPVGRGQCLVLVMGDQDGGGAGLGQQALDVGADRGPQVGVERAEWLIEEDEAGLDGKCARQRDPLLLAARELMRVAPAEARQADRVEQVADGLGAPFRPGEAEPDVRRDGEVREQAAFLRHVADAATLSGHVRAGPVDDGAAEGYRAAVGVLEADDDPQQGCLAAARRAQDRGE